MASIERGVMLGESSPSVTIEEVRAANAAIESINQIDTSDLAIVKTYRNTLVGPDMKKWSELTGKVEFSKPLSDFVAFIKQYHYHTPNSQFDSYYWYDVVRKRTNITLDKVFTKYKILVRRIPILKDYGEYQTTLLKSESAAEYLRILKFFPVTAARGCPGNNLLLTAWAYVPPAERLKGLVEPTLTKWSGDPFLSYFCPGMRRDAPIAPPIIAIGDREDTIPSVSNRYPTRNSIPTDDFMPSATGSFPFFTVDTTRGHTAFKDLLLKFDHRLSEDWNTASQKALLLSKHTADPVTLHNLLQTFCESVSRAIRSSIASPVTVTLTDRDTGAFIQEVQLRIPGDEAGLFINVNGKDLNPQQYLLSLVDKYYSLLENTMQQIGANIAQWEDKTFLPDAQKTADVLDPLMNPAITLISSSGALPVFGYKSGAASNIFQDRARSFTSSKAPAAKYQRLAPGIVASHMPVFKTAEGTFQSAYEANQNIGKKKSIVPYLILGAAAAYGISQGVG
jgi:hypothetical protein